jgi:signal transduction histidine kinase
MRSGLLILAFLLCGLPAQACERVLSLAESGWRAQRGDDPAWAQPAYDDSGWVHLDPGGLPPSGGPGPQDGFLWYRVSFHLAPEALRGPCHLLLGRIQESDEVYLNGQRIGGEGRIGERWYEFVSAMRHPRSYALPASLLVAGDNLLAVRVFSLYLTGGLPVADTRLGPPEPILREAQRLQRRVERVEMVTLTLLALGALVTGFLSLTRQSERQHLMLFGFILAASVIYLVDSLLFYPVRLEAAWTKRLVLVAGPLIPPMLLHYLAVVSGERFSRLIWVLALLPVLAALPMLFNLRLDTVMRLYDVWFLSFAPIIVVLLAFMVRRARYRMQQSVLLMFSGAVIAAGLLYALIGEASLPGEINPVELGILGMTALLMVAFARRLTREYEARLRLSAGVLSAQDEERRRIARELHDGLGQRLVAARLLLEAEALRHPGGALQEVVRELRDTTRELRAIVHGLRPVELGEVSLRSALVSYAQRVRELTGVHVQVTHGHHGYIAGEIEEHLFRIFQEAVNNAIRHGGAREVRIELAGVGSQLQVRIRDDGAGFRLEAGNERGLGLTAMAERVRLCHGQFHIESRVGEGTTLRIEIPLS